MFRLSCLAALLVASRAACATPSPMLDPSRVCSTMVDRTERQQRLPARLLHSMALVESGRLDRASGRLTPWPWTINVNGVGYFFETKPAAIAAVRALQAAGVVSIDVGCMQINLRYHPDAFASLDQAFEPSSNVTYGGRFLSLLHRTMQSWPKATAAYHSMDADRGGDYLRRVAMFWPQITQESAPAPPKAAPIIDANETDEFRAWQSQTHEDALRARALYATRPDPGAAAGAAMVD